MLKRIRRAAALANHHILAKAHYFTSEDTLTSKNSNTIVSLTTFPERADHAWIPIECMGKQICKPGRIILTVSREEFPSKCLPKELIEQKERGLEILWVNENTKSYKKILPIIKDCHKSILITIDDDIFFPPNFIETLLRLHRTHPRHLIGMRARHARLDHEDNLLPYRKWPLLKKAREGRSIFLTGAGGILYPQQAFQNPDFFNYELASKLCPYADDVWIWIHSIIEHRLALFAGQGKLRDVGIQRFTPRLCDFNQKRGGNDQQIMSALEFFGIRRTAINELIAERRHWT
jgi:hypothetical protein